MDDNVEDLARKRVQARIGLGIHLAMYAVVNLGLFVIWTTTGRGYPWFIWPMLGWGVGIVAHAIALVAGPGSDVERRAVEREVRRLRASTHP